LKALQQAESGTTEAAPISGDYSFVEPKTTSKSLQMRILDPVHNPGWDVVVALHRDAGCDPSGRQCLAPARSHDSRLHEKAFGKLPLVFNRLAGSMIYPHLD
jgi:hypothetical protein